MFGNILDLVASIYTVTPCRLHRIFGVLVLFDVLGGTPDYYLIGGITPEADAITTLIKRLSPDDQKTLYRLLNAYLEDRD